MHRQAPCRHPGQRLPPRHRVVHPHHGDSNGVLPARSPRPALVWRLRVITVGHQSQRCPPAAISGLSALGLMAPVLQPQADADPGEGGMVADSASPETCRPRTPTTTSARATSAVALADVALADVVVLSPPGLAALANALIG